MTTQNTETMPLYEMKCAAGDEPRILVTPEFIERNRLSIDVESAKEIMGEESLMGFEHDVAIDFIPLEDAGEYLQDEYLQKVASGEATYTQITDVAEAAQDFLDYMVFAWMKANDERGISASRSIMKLSAWMRILSRPDVADILNDDALYYPYGKPALREACEELGIERPDYL